MEELAQTVQLRRDVGFDAALRIVQTDVGRDFMQEIEATISTMAADEHDVLTLRLATVSSRGAWVRGLVLGGGAAAVLALLWAVHLLNQAWARSYRVETEQRTLALRLRASLDSLSQGVGVFDAQKQLIDWNTCFQVLLDLPRAMVRPGTPYVAFVEHTAEGGKEILESEDQIRYGRSRGGEPVTYERTRSDGHQLEIRRTPMPDDGFVLTVSDMTERSRAAYLIAVVQRESSCGRIG